MFNRNIDMMPPGISIKVDNKKLRYMSPPKSEKAHDNA